MYEANPFDAPAEENLSVYGIIAEIDESEDILEPIKQSESECEILLNYFNPIRYLDRWKFVPRGNVIEDFTNETFLTKVGVDLIEGYNSDQKSMTHWSEMVEFGMNLILPATHGRSEPWDNAANFKSPELLIASNKFGDRTVTELLQKDDLVKTKIYGKKTEEKDNKAERISTYMNYKIDEEIEDWRDEQEKVIYTLPYAGTVFKKTYFDSHLGRVASDRISYPNFTVDRYCTSLSELRRFSEDFEFSKNKITERMRSGSWRKIELSTSSDSAASDEGPTDHYHIFIEQQGFYDMDGDGYEEPYTFVIHKDTNQIVRIFPRFTPHDVIVRLKDDHRTPETTLATIYEKSLAEPEVQVMPNGNEMQLPTETIDFNDYEIVRIKPIQNLTMYGFLNDPEGGFLCVGYCYLLAALIQILNATTNQLLDAGTLANLSGGFLAKGFRAKMGDMRVKPGSFVQTGLSASELQSGIYPFPLKEPSQTLLNLREMTKGETKELAASADLKGALSANAPAATTLALVQEQQQSVGAIILRFYRSMSKELKKIFYLECEYADPQEYKEIVEDQEADFYRDFNIKISQISPNANPDFSSKMQRLQLAQAAISPLQILAMIPGINVRPIITAYYKALGASYSDEIAPELPPEQLLQKLLAENPQLQELIMQAQQRQALLDKAQAEEMEIAKQRAGINFNAEMLIKEQEARKIAAEVDLKKAETYLKDEQEKKVAAERLKILEEAKTESMTNRNM